MENQENPARVGKSYPSQLLLMPGRLSFSSTLAGVKTMRRPRVEKTVNKAQQPNMGADNETDAYNANIEDHHSRGGSRRIKNQNSRPPKQG